MYGKMHQRLDLKRLEDMSKIHSYYFSNGKKEFNYFGQNLSEDEVKKFLIDSFQLCFEETESDEEELYEIDEDNYEGNYYKNDYESNSENYNEDDENDNKSNNSLDIENDNSDNSNNNQTAKITNFLKTHNLRK